VAVTKENKRANRTSVKVHVMRLASSPAGAKFVELKVDAYGKSYVSIFELGRLAELDGKVLFDWVADQGAPIFTRKKRAQLFQKLVGSLTKLLNSEGRAPTKPTIALAADRRGWTSGHFISRYGVHSPPGREVLLSPNLAMADNRHFENVSLKRVQKFYRIYGRNNPLIRFCLCLAFAGPLLEVLERADQPWFVLIGRAGTGKTHLLHAVASPWGGDMGGILGYLSSFSGTLNSIEKLSVAAPDSLLALDDMQALTAATRDRAQILRDAIFRTATGRERGRFGAAQGDWRTISIFGSNDGMNKVMTDGTQVYDEPMQGRLIELHCQHKYGILSFVPDGTTPSRFVQAMKSEAVAIRGVAGERFLDHLVRERVEGIENLRHKLKVWMDELHDELGDDGFDGQTSRVVDVFALVFAAGCLTIEYGITPWSKQRLLEAVKIVFGDYDRRRRGDAEQLDAKQVLSNYVARHRDDFLDVDQDRVVSDRRTLAEAPGVSYRAPDGKRQYCFMPEQFAAIFTGPLQVPNAIRQLRSSGILMVDGKESSGVKFRPKRKLLAASRVRVYCIDRLLLSIRGAPAAGKSFVA
jgi:hypothetical protein